jgi:hypothetical protein
MQLPCLPCSTRVAGGSVEVDLGVLSLMKRVLKTMYLHATGASQHAG